MVLWCDVAYGMVINRHSERNERYCRILQANVHSSRLFLLISLSLAPPPLAASPEPTELSAAILVNFIWAVLAPVETTDPSTPTEDAEPRFQRLEDLRRVDLIRYALPGIGAYLQVTRIFPERMGVLTIVAYLVYALVRVLRIGFDQYSQHVLFFLLYIGLGLYL
jgi:hypothetical protein